MVQFLGRKSLCYLHSHDDVCEEWEIEANPKECGHFTPEGFIDQWPISAEDLNDPLCPVQGLIGRPKSIQMQGVSLLYPEDLYCALWC